MPLLEFGAMQRFPPGEGIFPPQQVLFKGLPKEREYFCPPAVAV